MNCYGTFDNDKSDCRECLWWESCKYLTDEPKEIYPLGKKMVSIERIYSIPDDQNSEESNNEEQITIDELAEFFNWLIRCDEYTLGIIQELIISPEITVSQLAAKHGVTRQAMHRKILSVIGRKKELSTLFLTTMPKLSSARKNFLRRK